jgi:hypothetical protein
MKKEWWIISVLVLVIVILVLIIIVPKSSLNISFLNKSLNNSNNQVEINNDCLKQGEIGVYGEDKCCSGLKEEIMQTANMGSVPRIVCTSSVVNIGKACTSDSQCSAGMKCWYCGSGPTTKGSLEHPGTCSSSSNCDYPNPGKTCTSNSQCSSGYICIRYVEGNTNKYSGVAGTLENPGNCILGDVEKSCTSDSDCPIGVKCVHCACGPVADLSIPNSTNPGVCGCSCTGTEP